MDVSQPIIDVRIGVLPFCKDIALAGYQPPHVNMLKFIRDFEDHVVAWRAPWIIDDIGNGGVIAQSNGLAEGILIHSQCFDQLIDPLADGGHILDMNKMLYI